MLAPPPLRPSAADSGQDLSDPGSAENESAEAAAEPTTSTASGTPRGTSDGAGSESWKSQTTIRELDPHVADPEYRAAHEGNRGLENMITLPRWTVYFQAGLLAVVATMFFVLGLMIGQNSTTPEVGATRMYDCQLTGRVTYSRDGEERPDEGAVVLLLPIDARLLERADPGGLRPDEFEPTDNSAIEQIEGVGGRVVRIDRDGEFDLTLRGPREYLVLIISRHVERAEGNEIPTADTSRVLGYFFAKDLIGQKMYHLSTVVLNRRSQSVGDIAF